MTQGYWLLLGVLAVWRITHLLQAEDGPWDLSAGLRRRVGHGFLGKLLDCFLCLSLWVSLPLALALGESWGERLLLWPALSAGAIVVQRLTERTLPASYYEEPLEKGDDDVMLRKNPPTGHGAAPHQQREAGPQSRAAAGSGSTDERGL